MERSRQVMIIYNPAAGPREMLREVQAVARKWQEERQWSVFLRITERPGMATDLAHEAALEGFHWVIAAGGDGTVNEVANGLVGMRAALGVLPVGTGNVWARQLGLPVYPLVHPLRIQIAAHLLEAAHEHAIDVGRANGRYFLLWAGIGLDAQVAQHMEPRTRNAKRLGALAYLIAAAMIAKDFPAMRATVIVDGRRRVKGRTLVVLVANAQLYGGLVRIAPQAVLDDGYLNVCVFRGMGLPWAIRHFFNVFGGRHLQDPAVKFFTGRRVVVETRPVVPVQVDGEPIGHTPMVFEIVPRSLRILVPPTAPADLFRGPSIL
ncbi:diacylglycerol/lipid kinase family protein [Thermoflexus sp.]|uniref:diacylglycerol/lipid kinase family protein n=1 Tax=Thermoflexus sp. TaxID=1969742 RepID=UPI0025D46BE4|nr:diacylglycerol kinase family protein [Thermoflexus sp.]MCS7351607.1 diacylglycerol kinase family lipid kinase [Thermoflexus sp.]MCX7689761.1 diacylglycerol kinase family lipid kinase [Thermoflexus sp.]MDW8181065.1 diacylglycerol kinase family lipid kinase [Anaerolineae bacterium]